MVEYQLEGGESDSGIRRAKKLARLKDISVLLEKE
jgi:hypothetical protein